MSLLITALFTVAALLGAAFGLMELRLLLRFLRNRNAVRAAVRSDASGTLEGSDDPPAPTVTIQLPLYNERFAAEQVIRASAAQHYPGDRFDIQVLDDSTDGTSDTVARVVAELQEDGVRIQHIRRGSREGYKAGALARGLERSNADFVAMFDADFTPGPDFLRRVLLEDDSFADGDVAFVQARWAWDHPVRGFFYSALALLLERHFFVQKPAQVFSGHVTTFNGSAGIWRRAAIEDAGGWSADTLTEDLDLSYRCAERGWRGHYRHDLAVPNELPSHMRAFKLQQRRWSRGSAQCFRKLTGRLFRTGAEVQDPVEETFLLAGYAVHLVLLANVLLWPWAVLYMDRALFWVIQGVMSLAIAAAPLSFLVTLKERDGRWGLDSLGQVVAGVCVGLGLMVNNSVAQLQGLLFGEGEFVRTPKGMRRGGGEAVGAELYRSPLHWTFFAEILVVAYCLAGSALLISSGEALWALPMLFWALCVGLVASLQMAAQPA